MSKLGLCHNDSRACWSSGAFNKCPRLRIPWRPHLIASGPTVHSVFPWRQCAGSAELFLGFRRVPQSMKQMCQVMSSLQQQNDCYWFIRSTAATMPSVGVPSSSSEGSSLSSSASRPAIPSAQRFPNRVLWILGASCRHYFVLASIVLCFALVVLIFQRRKPLCTNSVSKFTSFLAGQSILRSGRPNRP